jgi:hypothetical protein
MIVIIGIDWQLISEVLRTKWSKKGVDVAVGE